MRSRIVVLAVLGLAGCQDAAVDPAVPQVTVESTSWMGLTHDHRLMGPGMMPDAPPRGSRRLLVSVLVRNGTDRPAQPVRVRELELRTTTAVIAAASSTLEASSVGPRQGRAGTVLFDVPAGAGPVVALRWRHRRAATEIPLPRPS